MVKMVESGVAAALLTQGNLIKVLCITPKPHAELVLLKLRAPIETRPNEGVHG